MTPWPPPLFFFLLKTKIAGNCETLNLRSGLIVCVQLKQSVKCRNATQGMNAASRKQG